MNAKIAAQIQAAQDHGRQKHGNGPNDFEHDDSHEPEDWHTFIWAHNKKAENSTPMDRREELVKIAGLAVSAIESFDRNQQTPERSAMTE